MYALRWAPLGALLAMALAGCTTPGAMSHTALDFNETVARASDSQILLNIVRATYRNPTHYSAITQVRDSRTIQGTAGATATIPFGPDSLLGYIAAPTVSATGSLAPTMDVAPLDNKEAASGLFHPVDPQIPLTYWQQAWPPMVLLFLFVDDMTINDAAKRACGLTSVRGHYIDNAAYSAEHYALVRKLFKCLAPRMDTAAETKSKTVLSHAKIPPEKILESLVELDQADFQVKEQPDRDGKTYTVTKVKTGRKFVLHGFHIVPGGERAALLKDPVPAISFDLRSVDGMVYYLGELVRLQLQTGQPMTVPDHDGEAVLFNVEVASGADTADYIAADFLGQRYAISRHPKPRDRSLTVLTLLSQVFALYRSEKDLPKTSAVEVVGAR